MGIICPCNSSMTALIHLDNIALVGVRQLPDWQLKSIVQEIFKQNCQGHNLPANSCNHWSIINLLFNPPCPQPSTSISPPIPTRAMASAVSTSWPWNSSVRALRSSRCRGIPSRCEQPCSRLPQPWPPCPPAQPPPATQQTYSSALKRCPCPCSKLPGNGACALPGGSWLPLDSSVKPNTPGKASTCFPFPPIPSRMLFSITTTSHR